MSCVAIKNLVNIDLESHGITKDTLVNMFDIYDVSANDLMCGRIPFEMDEITMIAQHLGVTAEALVLN